MLIAESNSKSDPGKDQFVFFVEFQLSMKSDSIIASRKYCEIVPFGTWESASIYKVTRYVESMNCFFLYLYVYILYLFLWSA